MKNYQYVLDVETPFIKKLYDKEDDYRVEFLTPYGTLEELKKLQKENVDLEAKLAESEKQRQHIKDWLDNEILTSVDHESYYATINEYEEEVKQLKQQLAEKEEQYVQSLIKLEKEYDEQLEKQAKIHYKHLKEKNQDKISFAVEQLEKVKAFIEKRIAIITENYEEELIDGVRYSDMWFENKEVLKEIYNQIKQLKEKDNG